MEITRRQSLKLFGLGLAGAAVAPQVIMTALADEAGVKKLICPIYYWHEVDEDEFRSTVEDLLDKNYFPIAMRDVGNYFYDDVRIWPDETKPCVFTFDDARLSQFTKAIPVLDQYRLRATFYVLQNYADGTNEYMDDGKIKYLADGGWEPGVHGFTHRPLPSIRINNPKLWRADIVDAKKRLEDLTGSGVDTFSYPYGQSNGVDWETKQLVSENYRTAVSTGGDLSNLRSDNLFEIPRQWKS